MDLDFVPTLDDEDEDVVVVESSDDDDATAEARAAALKEANLAARRKEGKKGKKQKRKKSKKAKEPAAEDAFGTVTSMPFFSAGDFDDVDTRVVQSRSGNQRGEQKAEEAVGKSWDFAAGIQTRRQVAFDGLTSVLQKVREKRARRAKLAAEAPPPPVDETEKGNDSEEEEEEEEEEDASSDEEDASSDEDEEEEEGASSDEDSGDAESSEEDDSSESEEEEEEEEEEESMRLEADRTRALKEAAVAPGEDAAGQGYFEADPFLLKNGVREAQTFAALHLSRPLLRAVSELGYKAPTTIQRRVIPLCLAGRDVCGSAVTGSGKTAAFLLPALERLLFRPKHIPATRVLIVTPTRELATQILSMTTQLAKHTDIRAALAVGGHKLKVQEAELRARPEIVVCTPGRIIDLVRNSPSIHLDDVDILILDEADRLLEMGFRDEVEEIVKYCPVSRQTVLLSATMVAQVKELISLSLKKPVRVSADPLYDVAQRLSQEFVRIRENREGDREAILVSLVTRSFRKQVIVFCPTKKLAHRLTIVLGLAGVDCGELHGDLTQQQRLDALNAFKTRAIDILVATDLASRGLDIAGVKTVINFTMPRDLTRYVHRVGRTARAGRTGVAVTLTGENNRSAMRQIVKRASTNVKSRQVPVDVITYWRDKIASFEADVADILKQEAIEKELRVAQMEALRAANMMEHQKDIQSRPARTWFQSVAEKAAVKKAVLDQLRNGRTGAGSGSAADGGRMKTRKELKAELKAAAASQPKRPHRLTRHKRRRLEMAAEDARIMKQMARQDEADMDKELKARADALKREKHALKTQRSKAKAAKARVRDAQLAMNTSTGAALKVMRQGNAIPGAKKTVVVTKRDRSSAFEFDDLDVRKGRVVRQKVKEVPSAGSQVKSAGRRYAQPTRTRDRSAGQSFKFTEHVETRKLRKGGKPSRNAFKSLQRRNKRKRKK